MDNQQQIDFPRAEREALVRTAPIGPPPPPRKPGNKFYAASELATRAVLRVLGDHANRFGQCRPGEDRIAELSGISLETVRRALRRLELLDYLVTERTRGPDGLSRNRYVLVWTAMAVARMKASAASSGISNLKFQISNSGPPPGGPTGHRARLPGGDQPGTVRDQPGTMPAEPFLNRKKEPPSNRRGREAAAEVPDATRGERPPAPDPRIEAGGQTATATVARAGHDRRQLACFDELLRVAGVELHLTTAREALAAGWTFDQLADAVRTMQANRGLFTRPGAALRFFIQHHEWPAPGVRSPEKIAADRTAAPVAERRKPPGDRATGPSPSDQRRAAQADFARSVARWRELPAARRDELLAAARASHPGLAHRPDDSPVLIDAALELLDAPAADPASPLPHPSPLTSGP